MTDCTNNEPFVKTGKVYAQDQRLYPCDNPECNNKVCRRHLQSLYTIGDYCGACAETAKRVYSCQQRAEAIAELPPEDRRYYQEQLIRDFFATEVSEETRNLILALVERFLSDGCKQLVHDALRENAVWPEQVVSNDATQKLLE